MTSAVMALCCYLVVSALCFVAVFAALVTRARELERRSKTPLPVLECNLDSATPPTVSHRSFKDENVEVAFSIVIPCYNEAARIPQTLQSTTRFFDTLWATPGSPLKYEVVVVDDGSTDSTVEVVQHYAKYAATATHGTFRIFKLTQNSGKGVAVKEGFLRTRGALCLFIDADDATKISEFRSLHAHLTRMLNLHGEELEAANYRQLAKHLGVVVGSRAHLQTSAAARRSWYRNFLTSGFHSLVWISSRLPIQDTQCGFKLFTRAAVGRIFPFVKIRRWCFDVEVLLLATKNRIPVGEVPVDWTEVPGSKIRFHHIAHMAWELGMLLVGYTFLPSWKSWDLKKRD